MRTRAIIYLRKSNLKSADNDLEAHLRRALQVVEVGKLEFNPETDIYREPEGHRSGTSEKSRPAWQSTWERIVAKDSDVLYLIANDRARVWRDESEYMQFLKRIKKLGVQFIPASESPVMDINTSVGHASEGIMGLMNALYAKSVGEKRRDQYRSLRGETWYVATKMPTGLKSVGSKMQRRAAISDATYTYRDEERKYIDTVVEFFHRYSEGRLGLRDIAADLNARGYRWKHGERDEPIKFINLQRTLAKTRLYFEVGAIDEKLYAMVERVRESRKGRRAVGLYADKPLLLARSIYCARCGSRYTAERRNTYGNSLYRHPYNTCRWGGAVSAKFVDDQFITILRDMEQLDDSVKQQMFDEIEDGVNTQKELENEAKRKRLQTQIDNAFDAFLAGDFGSDLTLARPNYLRQRAEYEKALAEIPPKAVPKNRVNPKEYFRDLSRLWRLIESGIYESPVETNLWVRRLFPRLEFDPDTKVLRIAAMV